MTQPVKRGTDATRRFYDEVGWRVQGGNTVDHDLFGLKEDGPIRIELRRLHTDRVRLALSGAGAALNVLECGCGGNPATYILEMCSRYTGVDFSETGLQLARSSFAEVSIPHEFQKADICALPFKDGAFDAAFSCHMIYHIEDPAAQDAALAEMARVVRPGGAVVLIAANPYPLAFPVQLARGIARDMPFVGSALNRIRSKPPLPYRPMPIGWMRRRLARFGRVEVVTHDLPTTSFNQNVSEFRGVGKLRWKAVRWLDMYHPRVSAYLGSYVMLSLCKDPGGAPA
ncbi:MAG TPA: class I SAM-dependent methyltransferase [Bosea sp. (in: a-proteobacteria)]